MGRWSRQSHPMLEMATGESARDRVLASSVCALGQRRQLARTSDTG